MVPPYKLLVIPAQLFSIGQVPRLNTLLLQNQPCINNKSFSSAQTSQTKHFSQPN